MAVPPSKSRVPVRKKRTGPEPDPRIYGRHYTGPSPWVWGLLVTLLIAFGVYLAFAKKLPFTGEGFTLNAQFENAATLRPTSPVRIAGVNVGKVTQLDGEGDAVKVTFSVDDAGQPIHSDATIDIRPRLFLEGNFFLDLDPGSPSAPVLDQGDTIPVTQTATAVQIDEVLTALQAPARKGLQKALSGFGTGLTYEPTAADDVGQDPDVAGKTGAEALNQSLVYGGPAGRDTSIVNEALLGEGPHDLSGLIRAQRVIFGKLEGHETQLQDLITNFNVFTGALAAESANLSRTIAELAPTVEEARPSLAALSDALPPFRALAITLTPSIAELPATIKAGNPWLAQAKPLLAKSELGGLAQLLKASTPPLAATTVASKQLFSASEAFSRCVAQNLVPSGNIVIDDNGGAYPFGQGAAGFPSGVSNFQDFLSALVNQAGVGQGFDGNGSYLRVNTGGGAVLSSTPYPPGGFRNDVIFGNTQAPVLGTRPTFTSTVPPYRTDVACSSNPLPDVNGTGGAGLPGDVGPPQPEALP
jgi:ABC-type transporter Mla subunit MlaD